MGQDETKQQNTSTYENFLESLENISYQQKPHYFWIDGNVDVDENPQNEQYFRKYFNIKSFKSVRLFEEYIDRISSDVRINIISAASLSDSDYLRMDNNQLVQNIFLFCKSSKRAQQLIQKHVKIRFAKYDTVDLKNSIINWQKNFTSQQTRSSVLFMIEDDIDKVNKYRINFYSLTTDNDENKGKSDFVQFAKKLYPAEMVPNVAQFQKNFQTNLSKEAKKQQTLQWIEKGNFFINSILQYPKITLNPKKIGYIRYPFKQTFNAILNFYKNRSKKQKSVNTVYIVISLNADEIQKFKNNENNYILFTSFVQGFTSDKEAKKFSKTNQNFFLIQVNIPSSMSGKVVETLDFGYWIKKQKNGKNVLFNIYNVFEIKEFDDHGRQIVLQYGSLPFVAFKRLSARQQGKKLQPNEQILIRNSDYLENITQTINSETKILQMSGYFKESITACKVKTDYLRKSQPSQQIMDRQTLELANAYAMNQEYEQAEKQYNSIKSQKILLISLVNQAEMYLKKQDRSKFSKVVKELENKINKLEEISSDDTHLKAQNFICLELMNKNKFKQAKDEYGQLYKKVTQFYNFKYEGIPLVHQISRNWALCLTKVKSFDEALNKLNEMKSWQKSCEGSQSPSLLVTESLIKSVHSSRGSQPDVQKSEKEIQRIHSSMKKSDNIYLSRSINIIHVDKSSFEVLLPKMEESAININTNNQLQESAININI